MAIKASRALAQRAMLVIAFAGLFIIEIGDTALIGTLDESAGDTTLWF